MRLRRELGLFETTLYGVGMIVGAGIYVLIGKIAGLAGNGIWMSFALSSLLAIFTGLSYAELVSRFTRDSAEYDYVKASTKNNFLAILVGWFMLASLIISGSTVALGFAGYLSALINFSSPLFLAIFAILLFTWINFRGIRLSANINNFSTLLEVCGLLLIIFGVGFFTLSGKFTPPNYLDFPIEGVLSGAILAFFAYIGFGSLAKMGEETKNPEKTIPRAIILSVVITTLLYIGVAFSAITAVNPEELSISQEPAATIAEKINPNLRLLLSVIALFSTGNTILLILITSSRLLYGLANQHVFPSFLAKVHAKTGTPYLAVFISGFIAVLLSLFKEIRIVAEVTNLWTFICYAFVNLSVILLRYSKTEKLSVFRAPMNIGNFPVFALFGLIASLGMIGYAIKMTDFNPAHPSIWLTSLLIFLIGIYYLGSKKFK